MLRARRTVGLGLAVMIAWAALTVMVAKAQDLPPLGEREKIRLAWMQWQHFGAAGVSDEELMQGLATVGTTVFVDWGFHEARARLAKGHGMRYYGGLATASMRGPAEQLHARRAVNRNGLTCAEEFEAYKAGGGNINEPWGKYGEGKPAYVPCPLDPRPWVARTFKPALDGAKQGWLDGASLDLEPYGAYAFDQPGDMLCYCDDCFSKYRQYKHIEAQVERKERYAWLQEQGLLDDYLDRERTRLIAMLQRLAGRIRQVHPTFGFSAYPDFLPDDLRDSWRLQGLAMGLNSPQAPFIVINATPYWEDHTRPWWEAPHEAFRKLGVKHIMGSWDGGLMGHHPHVEVGAAEAMYEFAMASDGFWRWGERDFDTDDWRSFALVNQRLRQVEAKVGDYLLPDQRAPYFVTLVEQTGNPFLERALIVRTFEQQGRYLVLVNNGNTDWPVHVRLRFPRVPSDKLWRLYDPIHEVDYVQNDGRATWDAAALGAGVVVTLAGRGELFLLLKPAESGFQVDRYRAVRSFEVPAHRPRPAATDPLPEVESAAGADHVVFTRSACVGYQGATRGQALVTSLALADLAAEEMTTLLGLQGYCRQPRFSPTGEHVVAAVWVNGQGQIYLINALGGEARNISSNDYCDHSPRFSPDGKRIVFVSDRDGDWEIYAMNVDGSDQQRLTNSPGVDRSPSYSPDGQQIAFISDRGAGFDVYLMSADGSDQQVLAPRSGNEYEPTWSPDGQFVACTVQRRQTRCIQVSRRDGSASHFVAHGPATNISSICFSPDGERLAAAFSMYGEAGILVVDREARVEAQGQDWEGKKVEKIVAIPAAQPHSSEWYSTGTGSPRWVAKTFSGLDFSPDANTLVYCSDQDEDGQFRLYTIPVTGGEATAIAGSETAWPTTADWAEG